MTPEALEVLSTLKELNIRLTEPVNEEMRACGWRDDSPAMVAEILATFAAKVRIQGELPPKSERPWDMIRYLDHMGIRGGGPYADLLAFGRKLR
jgi:hypothetical protein